MHGGKPRSRRSSTRHGGGLEGAGQAFGDGARLHPLWWLNPVVASFESASRAVDVLSASVCPNEHNHAPNEWFEDLGNYEGRHANGGASLAGVAQTESRP